MTLLPNRIPTNRHTPKLVGEQSNAYRILLRYDRKSRHRRIKKQRRYERLAATSQLSLLHTTGLAPVESIISQARQNAPRRSPLDLWTLKGLRVDQEGPDGSRR